MRGHKPAGVSQVGKVDTYFNPAQGGLRGILRPIIGGPGYNRGGGVYFILI